MPQGLGLAVAQQSKMPAWHFFARIQPPHAAQHQSPRHRL